MGIENLIVLDVSDTEKPTRCPKCNEHTYVVDTIADGQKMYKHTCVKATCGYKFLSAKPAKNPKQTCPHCDNDLSVGGSVTRDFSADGLYNDDGEFINSSGYMDRENPDICSSCCEELPI